MKIIKKFIGHSNSEVLLIEDKKLFVRKTGDIQRNLERYNALRNLDMPIPKIYQQDKISYDMEYIPHLDMKQFLSMYNALELANFINQLFDKFAKNSYEYDYSLIYQNKLDKFNFDKYNLPFCKSQLYDCLPKILPRTPYHGDLTLENIIFDSVKKQFILIDPITTEYDSFVFDIAKLKQDLICQWFVRKDNYYFDTKLKIIYDSLCQFKYYDNKYLLILMLMRVLPYTTNQNDEIFLLNEVRKLWK